MDHQTITTNKEQPSVALEQPSVALPQGSNEVTSCPIGREGQPSCLFNHEIEKIKKILTTLLSQSPDAPFLKELSNLIHNPASSHCDLRSLLPTLLRAIENSPRAIEDRPSPYGLDEIKATIIASKKLKTNISIGEWLDTRIITAILLQFQYNMELSQIAPYRFGGCFRYDDFEVYDEKSAYCPCLSPSPDVDHLKWNYIKQAPFTHFIFNTCSRISTGQHFVSLVTKIQSNEVALLYFDSQHVGPYHNGEIPPDFHTRDFGNPFCNRFKNYTSHFDDWFDNLSKEANKDGYKIKLIHNMKTYQNNNYACGIYSLFHGIARAIRESKALSSDSTRAGNVDRASLPSSVDDVMDQFLDKLIQHN